MLSEKDLKYELEEVKFNLLKKHFVEKGGEYLNFYSKYNISKFEGLSQDLFIFSGHPAAENEKEFKNLGWRQIR